MRSGLTRFVVWHLPILCGDLEDRAGNSLERRTRRLPAAGSRPFPTGFVYPPREMSSALPAQRRPTGVMMRSASVGRAFLTSMVVVALMSLLPTASAIAAGWAIQPTVLPAGLSDSEMSDVSCSSSTSCMAVGDDDNGYNSSGTSILDPGALAEGWNGTAWEIEPVADTAGQTTSLARVSCVSATFCMAVGSTARAYLPLSPASGEGGGAGSRALAELWNGTGWTIQSTPSPTGKTGGGLTGVSCLRSTFCVAVGTIGAYQGGFAEIWNGSAWHLLPTLSSVQVRSLGQRGRLSRQRVSLTAVSCVTRTACAAVGSYDSDPGPGVNEYGAVAERWGGRRWTAQKFPSGSGEFTFNQVTDGTLTGVSCASKSSCMAVGYGPPIDGSGFDPSLQFADYWNGVRWTITPTVGIPRDHGDRRWPTGPLYGVSCTSPTMCIAVGQREPGEYTTSRAIHVEPLIQEWNGQRWTPVATPPAIATLTYGNAPVGNTLPALLGVSCVHGGACAAVGGGTAGPDVVSLAESDASSAPTAIS